MPYLIRRAGAAPSLAGRWNEPAWRGVPALALRYFLSQSRSRHPRVRVKAVYRDEGLFLLFRVQDRWVRSVRRHYQDNVCRDSCVEFFVAPRPGQGYFNFEINAGGTLLLHYQAPRPRRRGAPATYRRVRVPWALGRRVRIFHSLPRTVDPERAAAVEWRIECRIPWQIFEAYVGRLGALAGQTWHANFYKCGDATSHPHWASWAPMGPQLSFHLPRYFAPIRFGP